MSIKISVVRPPGEKLGGIVKVVLPNGHEFDREFLIGGDAVKFAEGMREGFVQALNLIGFVPQVDNQLAQRAA